MSVSKSLRQLGRPFRLLAIETSCDDTAVSIITSEKQVLANLVFNQHSIHAQHQGIVPYLACQEHKKALPHTIKQALTKARLEIQDIDVFAATRGPGIAASLSVGYDAGKLLAFVSSKPFYPIHHMEGHALMARMTDDEVKFPFLCLLISGGHTLLLLAKGLGDYTQLGTTLDDSVGEVIDKASRAVLLPYDKNVGPAAAFVQAALLGATTSDEYKIPIPKSARLMNSMDFSFSGMKTALQERCNSTLTMTDKVRSSLARSFLESCSEHLSDRLVKGIKILRDSHQGCPYDMTVVISGGVARNDFIFNQLKDAITKMGCKAIRPRPEHCNDNALMIAWTALEYISCGSEPLKYETVKQEWPLQDLKLEGKS